MRAEPGLEWGVAGATGLAVSVATAVECRTTELGGEQQVLQAQQRAAGGRWRAVCRMVNLELIINTI